MFVVGDVVKTIKHEQDIELIPAGTVVKLTKPNGEDLWWCIGVINYTRRNLLIRTNNLMAH